MGCDMFDSASYALFARNGRYMTAQGTARLEELEYFPCSCPSCHKNSPENVRKLLLPERERFLASHNLNSCFSELQTIKQAIVDGRLWELLEARSGSHPALQRAFQRLLRYEHDLERETPIRKNRGQFITTEESLHRPEILRHQERLLERYRVPSHAGIVVLLPEPFLKPFRENSAMEEMLAKIERRKDVHICGYNLAFAIIPHELLDVFPLSQSEDALPSTTSTINNAKKRALSYLKTARYKQGIIVVTQPWQKKFASSIRAGLGRRMKIRIIETTGDEKDSYSQILKALKQKSPSANKINLHSKSKLESRAMK